MGLMFGMMYCIYGFGFWFGVKIICDDRDTPEFMNCSMNCLADFETTPLDEILDCVNSCFRFDPGTVSTALFGILQGGMQIGQSATFAEAFNTARAAAASIYSIIDRQSEIDSLSFEGLHPSKMMGNISFKNVFFNYPSRKDVPILRGLSLDIKQGKCVALVGSSGCGKSTCIQLIQRFYDPDSGTVEVDGIDVKDLNIGWLRDNIGIVGQEPVLFDCTIKQNIAYANTDATDEEIIAACQQANAYNFIMKLPAQLDTMVGEGGAQLSGGQKQRIAIARALVRNPKILLLDEATSALDNESEGIVQAALDRAQSGRTTVIVAHRLTTIRNADEIVAIDNGEVKERGTHAELMKLNGLYYNLVMRQLSENKYQFLVKR
jgi:ATP-binding cassette subfamily B (MDR/TAP) protein 1